MTDETNGLLDMDEPLEQIGLLEQIEMLEKEPGQDGHADPADQIERADHRPDQAAEGGGLCHGPGRAGARRDHGGERHDARGGGRVDPRGAIHRVCE